MPEPLASPSTTLREQVAAARTEAFDAHRAGEAGKANARRLTASLERIVAGAFESAVARVPVPGAALVALGGFGRFEMSPFSDLDLMLLVPEDARRAGEALSHELFTPLWDAGLEPGTTVRTPKETIEATQEQTVATALLDGRVVAGDRGAGRVVLAGLWEQLSGDRLEAFIAEKVAEIEERRRRFGRSLYLLEPNLKTGVGGLRDLAGALWVFRARHRLAGITGVAHKGLLPRREIDALRAARDLILRVRCQLHLQANRRDDRLTYAAQERAARELGYLDGPEELAVERLMRDYYVAAQTVEHASDALVDRCTRESQPRKAPGRAQVLTASLELFDGRVTFRERADLAAEPSLLVNLFAVAERERAPVHSSARDRVAQEVQRLGPALASEPAATRAFLDYLESPGATGVALRGLYETGVIGGLFPEFARLRARVQHDVYHVYTVDTHTLFALQKLLRLRSGLLPEQPVFTRLCQDLPRPLPLYLGLFFHDLGKGLGGDHSVKGEALARAWAGRAGIDPDVIEDVGFLVREHLRLSQVAFRRDLSDPSLVAKVAAMCGTRERLDLLYLLTYADISSVGPETWNDWRSRLLGELHEKVRAVLDAAGPQGPGAFDPTEAARAGRRALREAIHDVARGAESERDRFLAILPERYLATVAPSAARHHFDVWRRAKGRVVTASVLPRPDLTDAADLVLVCDDRPGLLSLLAGTLAAHGIDILAAEIFSLEDGRALDAFVVREPGGAPPSAGRVANAMADLEQVLAGQEDVERLLARRRTTAWSVEPGPAVATKIRFDLGAARDATVVDVFARDRAGLLHDIASALHRAGASILLARVATEGNRATDGFYLQDLEGRKITEPERLEQIERAVAEALAPPATPPR